MLRRNSRRVLAGVLALAAGACAQPGGTASPASGAEHGSEPEQAQGQDVPSDDDPGADVRDEASADHGAADASMMLVRDAAVEHPVSSVTDAQVADASLDAAALPLRAEDVTRLPAGSARGSTFAGLYETAPQAPSAGSANESCQCRVGSCALLPVGAPEGTWSVNQVDGAFTLQMRGNYNGTCDGGIDADGSFRCGRRLADVEGGQELWLLQGRFEDSPAGALLEVTFSSRLSRPQLESPLDCDLRVAGRFLRPRTLP